MLVQHVTRTENEQARLSIARFHTSAATEVYGVSPADALQHAKLALAYKAILSPRQTNNFGYVFLRHGLTKDAVPLLGEAFRKADNPSASALAAYNLAMACLRESELENARRWLSKAAQHISGASDADKEMKCLDHPYIENGRVVFKELTKPRLDVAIKDAIDLLDHLAPTTP